MEIHLILEGEQVGPLSEAQVRQYLDEGLVLPTDLASHHGIDDWMPLERVLAHLPAVASTPGTVPPANLVDAPPSPEVHALDEENDPFIMPNESTPPPESTLPLTASQKTKRSKIVIQQLLPLETSLPAPKKTGKTALALDSLRSTIALPAAKAPTKAKSPGKGAVRTGKVALRAVPELAPKPAFTSPTTAAPAIPAPEVTPVVAPEPAPEPAPSPAAIVETPVEIPIEVKPPTIPIATETPVEPAAPPKPSTPPVITPAPASTAATKKPTNAPHFSVLPKDSAFMPPSIRSIGGPPPRPKRAAFPYAGVALAVFILGVILTCIFLFASRGGTAPTPNPFAPRSSIPPPTQTSVETPAPSSGPTTAGELNEQGQKLQSAGDLDGAIQDFDKAVALDPKAVEVYYNRGLARQAKGDAAGATADYTQVVALDPKRADAFSNRGFIKQRHQDFDGALADYSLALAIDPKFSVVYNNIGLIKTKKGDLDGAIAAYDQALSIDPKMAFAFYNRGVAKNTEGNLDGAIADFTQALAVNPHIALAYSNRGIARQAKNDLDGAADDFTRAVTLDPSQIDSFYNRAVIKLQRADFDGAVDDINHVLLIDSNYALAYDKRGLAFVGKNRPAAALTDLKKFCELAPRDPAADEARLYIWLMATESNANGDADAELSTALLNLWNSPPEDLTSKIASFLLGHITEDALIADAATPDPARAPGQYCRVWYFAGMKRLFDSDTAMATACFQKSVATGHKDSFEYVLAQGQLQALNPAAATKPAAAN